MKNCLSACLSSNGRLAGPAGETVRYFYAQDRYKRQIADGIAAMDVTGKDRETLGKLMN
jgi:hypothetical protein